MRAAFAASYAIQREVGHGTQMLVHTRSDVARILSVDVASLLVDGANE